MKRMLWMCLLLLPSLAFAQVEFDDTVVGSAFDGGLGVNAADLDGDGDMDVIGAAESADQFAWWEQTDAGWEYHFLGTMNWATDTDVADVDGDGDLDILAAAGTDEVSWFENDGTDTFPQHIIDNFDWTRDIEAADMDDDGDIDFVVAHNSGVSWLENVVPDSTFWPVHDIIDYNRARGMDVGDIDGDGDLDIAIGSADTQTINSVSWFENQGGSFGEHVLDDYHGMAYGVEIADINGDGAMDVVASARSDYISWWANGTWDQEFITEDFNGARDVYPGDIDGDGDMDVVGAAADGDEVAWFEQTDAGWVQHTIDNARDYASGVHVADMDDDGDLDVLGIWYYTDAIVLYTQLGEPEPDLVTFDVTPQNTTIPPSGGLVTYGIDLESIIPNPVPGLTYWTMVQLPNGQTYGPLMQVPFTMPPNADISIINMSQAVPAGAPGGNYQFTAFVGYMGNPDLQLNDGFSFNKIGTVAGAPGSGSMEGWQAGGEFRIADEDASDTAIPGRFQLSAAYPNPFNSATTVSVTLPHSAPLELTVHNVEGRQVATLHNSVAAPGSQRFVFDASSLAAGVYLIHARVPGEFDATRKVVFVK